MRRRTWQLAPWVVLIGLASCWSENRIVHEEPEPVWLDVSGLVVDAQDGHTLASASVTVNGWWTTTDDLGRFWVAVPFADAVLVEVTQRGYATTDTTVATAGAEAVSVELVVAPFGPALDVPSTNTTVRGDDGVAITLRGGTFRDSSGIPVEPPVTVRYTLLSDPADIVAAPGNMLGRTDAGDRPLVSYGMVDVVFSRSGAPVEYTGDATLQLPVRQGSGLVNGDVVPLWHYAPAERRWLAEGSARVVDGALVGDVTHFSWWNCDRVGPEYRGCVDGQLVQPSPSGRATRLRATATDMALALYGSAAPDGRFCMDLPEGRFDLDGVKLDGDRAWAWHEQVVVPGNGGQCGTSSCAVHVQIDPTPRDEACLAGTADPGTYPVAWLRIGSVIEETSFEADGQFCLDTPFGAVAACVNGSPVRLDPFSDATCSTRGCAEAGDVSRPGPYQVHEGSGWTSDTGDTGGFWDSGIHAVDFCGASWR